MNRSGRSSPGTGCAPPSAAGSWPTFRSACFSAAGSTRAPSSRRRRVSPRLGSWRRSPWASPRPCTTRRLSPVRWLATSVRSTTSSSSPRRTRPLSWPPSATRRTSRSQTPPFCRRSSSRVRRGRAPPSCWTAMAAMSSSAATRRHSPSLGPRSCTGCRAACSMPPRESSDACRGRLATVVSTSSSAISSAPPPIRRTFERRF